MDDRKIKTADKTATDDAIIVGTEGLSSDDDGANKKNIGYTRVADSSPASSISSTSPLLPPSDLSGSGNEADTESLSATPLSATQPSNTPLNPNEILQALHQGSLTQEQIENIFSHLNVLYGDNEELSQSLGNPLADPTNFSAQYKTHQMPLFLYHYLQLSNYYIYKKNARVENTIEGHLRFAIQFASTPKELQLLDTLLIKQSINIKLLGYLREKLHYLLWEEKKSQRIDDYAFLNERNKHGTITLAGKYYLAKMIQADYEINIALKERNTLARDLFLNITHSRESEELDNYRGSAFYELAQLEKETADQTSPSLWINYYCKAIQCNHVPAYNAFYAIANKAKRTQDAHFPLIALSLFTLPNNPKETETLGWVLEIADNDQTPHPEANYAMALYYAREKNMTQSIVYFKRAAHFNHEIAIKELSAHFCIDTLTQALGSIVADFRSKHGKSERPTDAVNQERALQFSRIEAVYNQLSAGIKTITSTQTLALQLDELIDIAKEATGEKIPQAESDKGVFATATYWLKSIKTPLTQGSQMGNRLKDALIALMPWIVGSDRSLCTLQTLETAFKPSISSLNYAAYYLLPQYFQEQTSTQMNRTIPSEFTEYLKPGVFTASAIRDAFLEVAFEGIKQERKMLKM